LGGVPSIESQAEQLKEALAARDAELAVRDAELVARDAELAARDAELAVRDAELVARDAGLAERDAGLAKRDAELAARESEIQKLRAEVERLATLVARLQERLGQNSSNSSKPPSSDSPGSKEKKGGGKGKRKRGGQKGHKGHHRTRLPESQVDVVDFYPKECTDCGASLPKTPDADARWHQVTEIPPVVPHTTEYRWHEVGCSCGCKTRAARGTDVPQSPFGPRLSSITAMLTGAYHLSRRRAQKLLSDLLGVSISLGGVSNVEARVSDALEPAVDEAWAAVDDARAKNTDGTSWITNNIPMQLWTIATTAATVFKIVVDGSKETLRPLYGRLKGILTSDRAKALNFWAMERRQICWSHYADLQIMPTHDGRLARVGFVGGDRCEGVGIIRVT